MISASPSRIAAFFDLDGTLIAKPSLEWRFFAWLIQRGAIPLENRRHWLVQAARLAPQGLTAMRHANKMYLRGISYRDLVGSNHNLYAGMAAPSFLPDAVHRLNWHAHHGHAIFLVTGTLEPLAREIAHALATLLAIREFNVPLGVQATRLQQRNAVWTGQVDGAPMFGAAKATAIRNVAAEMRIDLSDSYAYADSFTDRYLLEAVGHPGAVNPSSRLRRLAHRRAWPILSWPPSQPISSARRTAPLCSSGLPLGPEAFRQQEQIAKSE
jgi:alcohol-forming fatty acyl-CoA reductase